MIKRTVAAAAIVFVLALGLYQWFRTSEEQPPPPPAPTRSPEIVPPPSFPPGPSGTPSAGAPPAPETRSVTPDVAAPTPPAPSSAEPRVGGAENDVKAAEPIPPNPEVAREPSPPAVTVPPLPPPVVERPNPAEPLVSPPAPVAAEPPAVPGPVPPIPGPAAPSPASADLAAVQGVVTRYEQTYRQLDVNAVAAIWPTVDTRTLSRIFERLEQQDLRFETCAFALAEIRATATCAGLLTYVPRVGNGTPRTDRHTWSIQLERVGAQWQIVGVSAQ